MTDSNPRSHDFVRVWAEAALIYLVPPSDAAPLPDWQWDAEVPPLVAPTIEGSGIAIATGVHMGPVLVSVAEQPDNSATWEEHGSTRITINEPLGTIEDGKESFVLFRSATDGPHRVDVYAINRDVNRDLALKPKARKNLERYLVVFTPIEQGVGRNSE